MIEIKNLHIDKVKEPWDYICDRTTPVGNPYIISKYLVQVTEEKTNYDIACEKYEEWFANKLLDTSEESKDFKLYLEAIKNTLKKYGRVNLFCWCTPKRCHCETIKKWLEDNYER
jgi:hypothetical protein